MDETYFKLVRDFYILKTEYEINMQQLANTHKRLAADNEKLRKSFNELRDHVAESEAKTDKQGG